MRGGDWVRCASCGEDGIFHARDVLDFMCITCGCSAFIVASEIVSLEKIKNGKAFRDRRIQRELEE